MNSVAFTVHGLPVAKGSMNAFKKPSIGKEQRIVVTSTAGKKLKEWERRIADHAWVELNHRKLHRAIAGIGVSVNLKFHFSDEDVLGLLPHVQKPDLDKLTRAVLDGLTGVLYEDDAQVFEIVAVKQWGAMDCVFVEVKW